MGIWTIASYKSPFLYVIRRMLKKGCVLLTKILDSLYGLALHAAQAFEHLRHIYQRQLEAVLNPGP